MRLSIDNVHLNSALVVAFYTCANVGTLLYRRSTGVSNIYSFNTSTKGVLNITAVCLDSFTTLMMRRVRGEKQLRRAVSMSTTNDRAANKVRQERAKAERSASMSFNPAGGGGPAYMSRLGCLGFILFL